MECPYCQIECYRYKKDDIDVYQCEICDTEFRMATEFRSDTE